MELVLFECTRKLLALTRFINFGLSRIIIKLLGDIKVGYSLRYNFEAILII